MMFSFSSPPIEILDMALEATFEDGHKVQAMFVLPRDRLLPGRQLSLVYREGTTGRWLRSEGISFKGEQKTPETLVKSIGRADPVDMVYVVPAA